MTGSVMTLASERMQRRQQIEMRIEAYRDNATSSLLEIGRQLNAAKDEGLVPHGEWSAWVAEHAFMSERTAQAWMQAARELPPGSPLERLGIAKIRTLLTLPAGDREETAARIGAEQISSREVEEKVRAIRAERDEALRLVGEQKKKILDTAKEKQTAVIDAIARTRTDVSKEKEAEIRRFESLAKSAETGRKQTELLLDRARDQLDSARREAEALREELAAARSALNPEQTKQIALLEEQLKVRDSEIDRLADQLDEAQTAAMRGGMTGDGERRNPAATILSAIGALMAEAGRMPGELARAQGMDEETRDILRGQARLIGQWAMQILAACGEGDVHV